MRVEDDLKKLEHEKNVKFKEAIQIASKYFGAPRIKGSHHIFKTPWPGDPRVNIQPDEKNKKMAKGYQVKQLRKALEKVGESNK